jgi:hypothetical protein
MQFRTDKNCVDTPRDVVRLSACPQKVKKRYRKKKKEVRTSDSKRYRIKLSFLQVSVSLLSSS